jgi:hypothetical protein
MSGTDIAGLRVRKRLSDADRLQIATLKQVSMLPSPFLELIEWMLEHGEKGEQEGYL